MAFYCNKGQTGSNQIERNDNGTTKRITGTQSLSTSADNTFSLATVLNALPDMAVVLFDRNFNICYYNLATEQLFGHISSRPSGKNTMDISILGIPDTNECLQMLNQKVEYRYAIKLGSNDNFRLIENVIFPINISDNVSVGYIFTGKDITEIKRQEWRLSRKAAEESCLGKLLALSLEDLPTEKYLQASLTALLESVPWLNILPKGGIFIADNNFDYRILRLVASYKLSVEILDLCKQVPYGYCVCGRVAEQGVVKYVASSCDALHDISYPGMEPHGHYGVPIKLKDTILGVIIIYLPSNFITSNDDISFLERVSDVVSIGISKRQAEKDIKYQSNHDDLTALPNRKQLKYHLEHALARADRHGLIGALMFIDLDHFKNINDSLGHAVGDELLKQVSARLVNTLRKEDSVARLGGDEFVILLAEENSAHNELVKHSQIIAEKIRVVISNSYLIKGYSLNVTPSIGITLFPNSSKTASEVLQQADTAMYRAKAEGRNCVRFYSADMQVYANDRLIIEQDLRWALENQQLLLFFQPQVDIDGILIGAEVLLRCPNSKRGLNRVDLCIDVAEATGLILPLGEWILREACRNMITWIADDLDTKVPHLCINISPKQFLQNDFMILVQNILAETGIDPERLVFEITESAFLENHIEAVKTMHELRELGIRIAIDDFGTGYSSLSYITQLPIDILKIDRSFVTGVNNNPRNAAVVEALISMGNKLGFSLIAEGVETKEELDYLINEGCSNFQGYYFGRPISAQSFKDYISQ